MRILIDTNILIQLEDNRQIDESFSAFYQFAISNKCAVYYHKACIKDVKRDSNKERQEVTLSKLKKYTQMPDLGTPSAEFITSVGQKNENDEIDNIQLYQIAKGYIDYFITEDKSIHAKATKLSLKNKVLGIAEGLKILREKYILVIPQHPLLEECSVRDIENELQVSFFDSLREGYDGFNDWFVKCAQENRRCYVLRIEKSIAALLIFNREKKEDHKLPGIEDDALKMCTLKVAETAFGYRLGELFLNKMFTYCINASVGHLYLTVFPHHVHLIELLEKYGFRKEEFINKNNQQELRMIKSLIKSDYLQMSQAIQAHPFYVDKSDRNKFVIPIEPKYYYTLFKDGAFRQKGLFDDTASSLNEIEGNTISKAYLCKSKRVSMKPGDLLFFYGSKTIQSIEPIGVLDSVTYTKDLEEIKNLVKRKTVYSDEDLEKINEGGKTVTVLIFRLLYYLPKPVPFKKIKTLESYSNNFQTITTLSEKDYINLKQNNYFNERFIIN